jgi:hypothetical protein
MESEKCGPGQDSCIPIERERARRREEDDKLARALAGVRSELHGARKWLKLTGLGVAFMVGCAMLEYTGAVLRTDPPIWARAIVHGAMLALKR